MALKILQPGIEPAGQFDIEDASAGILGGEIGTVTALSRANTLTERSTADVKSGYTNNIEQKRMGVTTNIKENGLRPLWLLDDGTRGYGTLFGQTIGTPTGLGPGVIMGPSSLVGSGKVTVWNKPGIYGVSLDAVDTSVLLGLQPTNASMEPGIALFPMADGKLTPTAARAAGGAIGADVVARFLQFVTTSYILVTTPRSLVEASDEIAFAAIEYRTEG